MGSKSKNKHNKRKPEPSNLTSKDDGREPAGGGSGAKVITDSRFASVHSDPRFQRVPKHKAKVAIDSRFNRMFSDKSFSSSAAPLDKRGRPKKQSSQSSLRHYYRIEEDGGREEETDEEEEQEEVEEQRESVAKRAELSEESEESDSEDESEYGSEAELESGDESDSTTDTDEEGDEEVSEEEGVEVQVTLCSSVLAEFCIASFLHHVFWYTPLEAFWNFWEKDADVVERLQWQKKCSSDEIDNSMIATSGNPVSCNKQLTDDTVLSSLEEKTISDGADCPD